MPETVALDKISMISSEDGWMVDTGQRLFRWNGQELKLSLENPQLHFQDITMVDSQEGWLVGYNASLEGVIWHWDGKEWSELSFPVGLVYCNGFA
jgi:hypothetical protein